MDASNTSPEMALVFLLSLWKNEKAAYTPMAIVANAHTLKPMRVKPEPFCEV